MIASDRPCLGEMIEAHAGIGGCMLATMLVDREKVPNYGILDVAEEKGALVRARGIVEKPSVEAAPSRHAVIGRYILTPSVLRSLGRIRRGAGGEVQLTDAIQQEIARGQPVHGFRFEGQRYDCGSKAGYLQATVAFALSRPELRDEFAGFLHEILAMPHAAE
ncbi:MAG: hypothetical protein KatS3mg118_3751 [Paracoccaceae bacterium]|nr:MAG: hypothetical protein KatS3mg118_3751 [Paracoccaceae bacterium]